MTARIALGVALAALVLSTAGTGYAVTRLAAGSVGARALKPGAVRSVAVRDGSLRAADLSRATRARLRGAAGPQGAPGPQGPAGPQGAAGRDGAPGAVATLGVEAAKFTPALPASTPFVPVDCRTPAHVAGRGEVAMVDAEVSLFPTASANAVLYGSVAVSEDGGTFASASLQGMEGMGDGVASVGVARRIPLTPGVAYRFGVMVESSGAVNAFKSTCQVLATIVRS